jgi:hypothetical protein
MKISLNRAAILGTLIVAIGCAPQIHVKNRTPVSAEKLDELWQMPRDIATRDLLHGAGGARMLPTADAPFTWVATDTTGYSPGFTVRDANGRRWDVKVGPEAQTEVVASRVLWAIGYHQPAVYYLPGWQLSGGPGGQQAGARFRPEDSGEEVIGEWSWSDNEFIGTQQFHGLITTNILLNSWDWKTSNNKIYRAMDGSAPLRRLVVRDLGASLGKTAPSRLLWFLPISVRGFGQGSRNNLDDFESVGFIKRIDENDVEFEFDTIYGSVVDLVRPSDVQWTAQLLSRISDAQWEEAFKAADYSRDVRARYIRKIKAKIAEGLAVS